MMSGHGANPIFFNNKEIKIGHPEHLIPPLHPPPTDNILFIPYPTTTPSPNLKVDVICVSPPRDNGLVVKALDSHSRSPVFKTTGWLQGRLSLSSFQGR